MRQDFISQNRDLDVLHKHTYIQMHRGEGYFSVHLGGSSTYPPTQPYRRNNHKLNQILPFLSAQTTEVAL